MRVVISGASGLIGSALSRALSSDGHQVLRLVRTEQQAQTKDAIFYDLRNNTVDQSGLEGVDAVVHLAGANIADGRWTEARKQQILSSRVQGTNTLARAIAGLDQKPEVFVCASAVGYYGDRGDEILDEDSAGGAGFTAEVVRAWEAAAQPALEAGVRTVFLRQGVVLDPSGGALKKMLTPFRLGIAGRLGNGRQWMSWISLDDVVLALQHLVTRKDLSGVFLATSPHPVTNAEFTRILGKVLGRPTILPVPAFALRIALGQMADELLLSSARAVPTRLQASGFTFRRPELEDCLRQLLDRKQAAPKSQG